MEETNDALAALGLTEQELKDVGLWHDPEAVEATPAEITAEITEAALEPEVTPRVRQYIPCTGPQISAFLAAVSNGMVDAHYATESEVDAFVAAGK